MENIFEIIKSRRSVRTYDGREICAEDREKLATYARSVDNPYGIKVGFKFLDGQECGLKCPVVVGTKAYVGGMIEKGEFAFEAFGYSFEKLILYAQSLGLGTVWLGGTMNRGAFERAMELDGNEIMPCATALGYASDKMALREKMMRSAIKADSRMGFGELFFDSEFRPLSEEKAGKTALPLEAVRLAPSAVNKQPWRVVVSDNAVRFYLKRSMGFSGSMSLDMQKIDMGIALCHFDLVAHKCGLDVEFKREENAPVYENTEYVATFFVQ